jgi:hypothetical protein
MVHTCPRCELRFVNQSELDFHLAEDHGVDRSVTDRYQYQRGPSRSVESGSRRYLVVANQTIHTGELENRIRELAAAGPAHFFVVVPATHPEDHLAAPGPTLVDDDPEGKALAALRLRHLVDRLHVQKIETEGEVGHPDPFHAVADAIRRHPADEIIVSTLPRALSKWMAADLPRRLERNFGLPVSVVEEPG